MKFTDEEKDEIAKYSKTYWKEILIFAFFAIAVFNYWRLDETKKDLAEAVRISTVGRTLAEINAGLADVDRRENEIYPKMDQTISDLNTSIKTLNNEVKKLNKPKKEQNYENFKKQSIQDLGKWFSDNGYPNTVSPSK